jgi:hypothetical protein
MNNDLWWTLLIGTGSAIICGILAKTRGDKIFPQAVFGFLLAIIAVPFNIYKNIRVGTSPARPVGYVSFALVLVLLGGAVWSLFFRPPSCSSEEVTALAKKLLLDKFSVEVDQKGFHAVVTTLSGNGYQCRALYSGKKDGTMVSDQLVNYRVDLTDGGNGEFLLTIN